MRSEQEFTRARHARRRLQMTVAVSAGIALGLAATAGAAAAAVPVAVGATTASAILAAAPEPSAAALGVPTLARISADAESRLDDARRVLADASSLTAEVGDSGLALDAPAASIDTGDLQVAADRLSDTDVVPLLLLPPLADDAAVETSAVAARVADVRENLDAARAERAAAEAAAEERRQAEAAAAAEAQRQAERAAELASANTPAGAKAVAQRMAAEKYGWGSDQFSCLSSLWQRESGWNYQAYNASSGATGIPQALPGSKMASAGSDWKSNAATQIAWGLQYISSAYGTPCGAWGKSQSSGWY